MDEPGGKSNAMKERIDRANFFDWAHLSSFNEMTKDILAYVLSPLIFVKSLIE